MNILTKIGKVITDIVLIFGAIAIATATFAYGINSLLRLAKMPLSWPEEYCTYIIVFAVFLMQARLEFEDNELCIGVIEGLFKKSLVFEKIMYAFRYIVTGGMYVVLIKVMMKVINQNLKYGTVTPVLRISFGIYYIMIAACFAIALLVIVLKLITKIGERRASLNE